MTKEQPRYSLEEFEELFWQDESAQNRSIQTIESAQMMARVRRTDLNLRYYFTAFLSLAEHNPEHRRHFFEYASHLNRFIMSHIRYNREMMTQPAPSGGGDQYNNLKRNRS